MRCQSGGGGTGQGVGHMTVRGVAGCVRSCRRSFPGRGKIAAGAAPASGGGIRHGGGARLSPRVFLCFPLACVVLMSGRVHAVAPMLGSRIARSCLRLRNRWLLMEIGRAACRERVGRIVEIPVVATRLKKKNKK